MSRNFTTALIVSFGLTVWVYTKMMRSSSSDVKSSTMIGAICFGVFFIISYGVLAMLPDWWNS